MILLHLEFIVAVALAVLLSWFLIKWLRSDCLFNCDEDEIEANAHTPWMFYKMRAAKDMAKADDVLWYMRSAWHGISGEIGRDFWYLRSEDRRFGSSIGFTLASGKRLETTLPQIATIKDIRSWMIAVHETETKHDPRTDL